jgi:hypothetical protein
VISPTSGSNDIQGLAKSLTVFLLTGLQNPQRQIIVGWGTDVNAANGTISVSQNAQVAQELDLATNIALTTDVVWVLAVLGFTAG